MDLAAIAQGVTAAVSAYLADSGATYVVDSVESQVYAWLSEKLRTSRIGRHVLEVLTQNPTDPSAQTAVEQAILDRAEQDQHFEGELRSWAARLEQVTTTQGSVGEGGVAHGGVNIAGSGHGKISLRGVMAGRDHIDQSRRTLRVNTGGLIGIAAVVVVVLVGAPLIFFDRDQATPQPNQATPQPKTLPSEAVEALNSVRFCGRDSQGCEVVDAIRAPSRAEGDANYNEVWCVVYRYELHNRTGIAGNVLGRQAMLWTVIEEGESKDAFLKRGCSNYRIS